MVVVAKVSLTETGLAFLALAVVVVKVMERHLVVQEEIATLRSRQETSGMVEVLLAPELVAPRHTPRTRRMMEVLAETEVLGVQQGPSEAKAPLAVPSLPTLHPKMVSAPAVVLQAREAMQ